MNNDKQYPTLLRAWIAAFVFLTRLPMPQLKHLNAEDSGRAFAWFPFVGLCIGLLLFVIAALLQTVFSSMIIAAIILTLWVLITGGLHIDGLADSADGWLAGGDKKRTLTIMKDPHTGSAGVMIVCCLLLLKFAALTSLLEPLPFGHPLSLQSLTPIILAPLLGRSATLVLFLTTPYANPTGIARDFINHTSRPQLIGAVLITTALLFVVCSPARALLILTISALLLWGLRCMMLARLGGNTGDTSGASCEIIEMAVLVCGSVLIH